MEVPAHAHSMLSVGILQRKSSQGTERPCQSHREHQMTASSTTKRAVNHQVMALFAKRGSSHDFWQLGFPRGRPMIHIKVAFCDVLFPDTPSEIHLVPKILRWWVFDGAIRKSALRM